MTSTAGAIPTLLKPGYAVWPEGTARTDSEFLRSRDELKELSSASRTAIAAEKHDPIADATSSTLPMIDSEAELMFERAFRSAKELQFEDGLDSDFSQKLVSLVRTYGQTSKEILSRLLEDRRVSREVLSEAMRWLGQMDDRSSSRIRLWLLERGLTSSSAVVRDGAAVGLASMNDPSAIPYLIQAIRSESLEELRKDMEKVLEQLRNDI